LLLAAWALDSMTVLISASYSPADQPMRIRQRFALSLEPRGYWGTTYPRKNAILFHISTGLEYIGK
jgi:hypothetical protein